MTGAEVEHFVIRFDPTPWVPPRTTQGPSPVATAKEGHNFVLLIVVVCIAFMILALWLNRDSPVVSSVGERMKGTYRRFEKRVLVGALDPRNPGRWTPELWRIGWVLLVAAIGVGVFAWVVFYSIAEFSGYNPKLYKPWDGGVPSADRGDVVRDSLGVVALFGATAAAVYAYRKQRLDEASSRRADADGLATRYQNAASLLGSERASVRLAGVYSLARLADDWEDQRQTCIDVLCAYLRTPLQGQDADEELDVDVRRAIQGVIVEHLGASPERSWSSLAFNFTGATLYDLRLSSAQFHQLVRFDKAQFVGETWLTGTFDGGLSLVGAQIRGEATLQPDALNGEISLDHLVVVSNCTFQVRYSSRRGPLHLYMSKVRVLADATLGVSIQIPDQDERLAPVFMDDWVIEGGTVDVRFGMQLEPFNTGPFVYARRWVVAAPKGIYVYSVHGQGEVPPNSESVFVFEGMPAQGHNDGAGR